MNKLKRIYNIRRGKLFIRMTCWLFPVMLMVGMFSCDEELTTTPFYEGIYEGMNESITEYIVASKDTFSMFRQLIETGSLYWTLTAYNPNGNDYTLFLPTNEAIEKFIEHNDAFNSFQDLLADVEYVNILVRYHIVNRAIQKNDFPYGALPDTTLSGDLLTISYLGDVGQSIIKVNNEASINRFDIELTNGFIHIVDAVLEPIVFSSYEWLSRIPDYSIFTGALELTRLSDTFKIESIGKEPRYPSNTLLVEPNEVFAARGIFSLDDLKEKYSPGNQEYTNYSNGLYQFISYHIIEGKKFLNNFEGVNTNYNTYSSLPVWINGTGLELKINAGIEVFDSIITQNDTTLINYVSFNYDESNISTKNGAIHFINNIMEQFRPSPTQRIFEFQEEPLISDAKQNPGNYRFDLEDLEIFEVLKWQGVDEIEYVYSSTNLPDVWGNDYLQIEGSFSISYEIPKILPGNYALQIRANDEYYNNAVIQVYLDGKSMGGNIDLKGNQNKNATFYTYEIGNVVFDNYEKHTLRIQTLIPGRFTWDAVVFKPV